MIKQQVMTKSLNENITEDQSKKKADEVLMAMPVLNKCLESSVKARSSDEARKYQRG